ncbi:MAG TPA: ATP-binding protein [Armatimonadota bacterium]|nr:ATP-binding protein [Armatimonadota bacterium]
MARRKEIIEFRIPADPECARIVRKAVQSIARSLGFSQETAGDIELSVAEAVANAVEHGSPRSGEDVVMIVCRVTGDKLVVDVEDKGPGFTLPRRNRRWELLDDRGRGLRLIQHFMDKVTVCRTKKGCRITMAKKHGKATQLQSAN